MNELHLCILRETTNDQWNPVEAIHITEEQLRLIRQILGNLAVETLGRLSDGS